MSGTSTLKSALLLAAILLLAPCRGGSSTTSTRGRVYVFHYENVLGTSLEIKVVASSAAQSEKAEKAVLAEIERESHILSSWDPDSEFSRWFRTMGQPVMISPELFEVLSLFDKWRGLTDGALDASAEAITRVWKHAAAEKRLPSQAELDAAVASVRKVHWQLDPANRTATHTSDAPLAMNSFVKSYIAGRAAETGARCIGCNRAWSSTSAETSSSEAIGGSRSTSPIRNRMRKMAFRSRGSSFVTAPWRPAEITAAASRSAGVTIRILSIREQGCPRTKLSAPLSSLRLPQRRARWPLRFPF